MNEAIRGKVIRPNIECTNGYIHLIDTVMLDDSPPYAVIASGAVGSIKFAIELGCIIQMTIITLTLTFFT